jgi:Ca2+-binding RTX toxin-like protein
MAISYRSDSNWMLGTAKNFIKKFESFKPTVYDDGKGIPTIGFGFALVVDNGGWQITPNLASKLQDAGIQDGLDGDGNLEPGIQDTLEEIALEKENGNDALAQQLVDQIDGSNSPWSLTEAQAGALLDDELQNEASAALNRRLKEELEAEGYSDATIEQVQNNVQGTREGAALLSLAYNHAEGDTLKGVEAVVGSDHADFLFGDGAANRLEGGAGDDRLSGRGGPDQLIGGRGTDTVTYMGAPSAVEVDLAAGIGRGGFAEGDTLAGIENLTGTASGDRLFGNGDSNTLKGEQGDDLLTGRQGGDRLIGGAGTDTASYADSSAGVSVNLASGVAAGGSAQGDVLTGIEGLKGSGHSDQLVGDDGANPLSGLAGSDRLSGLAGGDTLDGGAGSDRLYGNAGDDTLAGGRGSDLLFGGRGEDTASYAEAAEGVTVNLTCHYTHQGSGTDLLFGMEHARGSAFNDTLIGDSGANRLDGGNGDDRLRGGRGGDTVIGGAGTDTAVYSDSWKSVSVDLGAGTASGGTADGDTLKGIESVVGSFRSDSLIGDGSANTLSGRFGFDHLRGAGGDDTLNGGWLHDHLEGGSGADLLNGGRHHDRLVGGTGTDWVNGDKGLDRIAGGQGNDALLGGAHRDRLQGSPGNDLLAGGAGSDALSIGGSDVVLHNRGEGRDRVEGLGRTDQLTISLGGGTSLEGLSLSRRRDDLLLHTGGNGRGERRFGALFGGGRNGRDRLVLEDWYADGSSGQPESATLQMVTEATDGYDPNADSERLSHKLNRYDFTKIVEAFDQTRDQQPGRGKGRRWEAMDAALANHLASSDSEALGGELAHRYGAKGSLEGASRQTVLATLSDERFGETPQSLKGAGSA